LIRLSLVAVRRELRGANIVAICAFCNLGLWILSSILFSLHIPGYGHEWLFHGFYLVSFLCFPLTLSILLSLEHGWVNGQLVDRIQEIETQIGLPLCRVGSKIKLVIPSLYAYTIGTSNPLFYPNSTLVFEVELLDVKPPTN